MKTMETIKNYIVDQNRSDSGDQLTVWIIILGVMALVAIAVLLFFGDAIMKTAESSQADTDKAFSDVKKETKKVTSKTRFK